MKRQELMFPIIGSAMTILFIAVVNYLTNPDFLWFLYPSFVLVLWPLSMYFLQKGRYPFLVLAIGLITLCFLFALNYTQSPGYPWILYTLYPILLCVFLSLIGRHWTHFTVSLFGSGCGILYYAFLNFFLSPGYPWFIFPAFVFLWWPIVSYFAGRKQYFGFSIFATLLTILFFVTVNAISSPDTIWAVYPIFAVLWWPLSLYYYGPERNSRA